MFDGSLAEQTLICVGQPLEFLAMALSFIVFLINHFWPSKVCSETKKTSMR